MQAPIGLLTTAILASTATAQISLAQHNLFRIDGPAPSSWYGEPVQGGIGDVNRDGYPDFISVNPHSSFHIYSGKNGTEIYSFAQAVGGFGQNGSISPGGDVDKDGFNDIFVGASGGGPNSEGRVWVISGSFIFSKTIPEVLYTFDGEATGGASHDNPGWAGDVDGDGYDDILVGDNFWDDAGSTDVGKAYLYSGKDGKVLYTRKGTQVGQRLGTSVYGCGDMNKDGFPDLAITSGRFDGVRGSDVGLLEIISGLYIVTSAPPEVLYSKEGEAANDRFGGGLDNIIEGGVDLNRDNWPDLVISSNGFDGPAGGNTGKIYVLSGQFVHVKAGKEFLWEWIGDQAGNYLGSDVNFAEDLNRDGFPDVVAGGPWGGGPGRIVAWSGMDGKELLRVVGEAPGNNFGYRVDGIGDINMDGYGDLVTGAWNYGTPRGIGRCYAISGKKLMVESYEYIHSLAGPSTTQNFSLDADPVNANRNYILATSLGTGPFQIGSVTVPLSVDPWFLQALPLILSANAFFPNWTGSLDASGKAQASWTLPANNNPTLVGLTLWQACLVWHTQGGVGVFDAASNAVPMTLLR